MKRKLKKQIKATQAQRSRTIWDRLWILLIGTFAALIPQYAIRSSIKTLMYFYNKFTTYPGDVWYCWSHYLNKGFPYPVEYPAGIRLMFQVIFRIDALRYNFNTYMLAMSVFLALFAVGITFLLYRLLLDKKLDPARLWRYWILAPTFLFYGIFNLDMITVFTMILGYYLFVEEEYHMSAAILALGAAIKVYPAFLTPLFFFACPKKYRLGSVVSFVIIWAAFNVPFMLKDIKGWYYPYEWQIKNNFAKCATDGSWWWVVHKLTGWGGKIIGRASLALFGLLYGVFLWRKKDLPLEAKAAGVMILFLLTDRIYSPQYNLYLLPFLVLLSFDVDWRLFYVIGITNVIHVMFLFFFKNNPTFYPGLYLQIIVFIKYIALILLFWQISTQGKPISLQGLRESLGISGKQALKKVRRG